MLRCALLAVYCTALATAQFAKEMQVETVIKLKESYTTDRALPTYFSGEENLPTEITQKIFSSIEAKAKNVLIELIPDFDVRWFNLINFELTEHHNPITMDLNGLKIGNSRNQDAQIEKCRSRCPGRDAQIEMPRCPDRDAQIKKPRSRCPNSDF